MLYLTLLNGYYNKAMNSAQSLCSESIKLLAFKTGFDAVGIARAEPVAKTEMYQRQDWIKSEMNAQMSYLERNTDLRSNPCLLLSGCKSIIVLASSYHSEISSKIIAQYALGDDYHDVLRQKVKPITDLLNQHGFTTRVCVDTAPMAERYWAVKAGVGFIGLNSLLIVPNIGSRVFLVEILTDAILESDSPCELSCKKCGKCISCCPDKAINENKTVDARRCLSYLTIEHRGDFPDDLNIHGRLYGCDRCQEVCPHNQHSVSLTFKEFEPRPDVVNLAVEQAASMTQEQFSKMFKGSTIKRTKLAGLTRNALQILKNRKD